VHKQLFLVAAAVLLLCPLSGHAKDARKNSQCDAPNYFGICDSYVPGTIAGFPEKQPISVIDTWHNGPAERAGVCPGDKIVAVNGVVAVQNTMDGMLHEIVSAKPSRVVLRIKRGDQTLEFHVRRVRESTLAGLSHQKFLNDPSLGRAAVTVPKSEKRTEFTRYVDFFKMLEEREGITRIEGQDVPVGTPPEQAKRIRQLSSGSPDNPREADWVGPTSGKYSFGFTALVLKDPSDVLVERVFPQSPALRAGLLPGDRVLEVNGRDVFASGSVKASFLEPDEERSISLKVDRGGEQKIFELRSELEGKTVAADLTWELPHPSGRPRFDPNTYFLGIRVLYSPEPREAMISRVEWPSPASAAGLHVGDSILAINGKPTSAISQEDLGKFLVPQGPAPLKLEISRLGKKKTLTVKPATHRDAEEAIGRKPTKSGFVPQGCPAS
jgi:C-terminal processing protease CtpA/Prc